MQKRSSLVVLPVLRLLALGLLIALWILPLYFYHRLPDQVPVHFNLGGDADRWGNRTMLWLLPILGTLIYGVLGWLSTRPEQLNYLQKITPENAARQYAQGIWVLQMVRFLALTVFVFVMVNTLRIALGHPPFLQGNGWGLAVLLAFLGFNCYALYRMGKKEV
jgi:uncharacterized membrane protein